jgi:hypothetical protein
MWGVGKVTWLRYDNIFVHRSDLWRTQMTNWDHRGTTYTGYRSDRACTEVSLPLDCYQMAKSRDIV